MNETIHVPADDAEQKLELKKPPSLSPMQQLEAISWAAREAGSSYGAFSVRLTQEEKNEIYVQYAIWQKNRAQELRERMAQRAK